MPTPAATGASAFAPEAPANASDLRVVILSDAAPERNGVGAYYHDLVANLDSEVGCIELISPHHGRRAWHSWLSLPLPGDSTQKLCLPAVRGIGRRVRAARPQVLVAPTPGPYGLLAAYLSRRLRIPLVVGFHTHFHRLSHLYWNRVVGGINRSYFDVSNRLLFRSASLVVANSRDMIAEAERIGTPATELVGTPLPRDFVETPPARLSGRVGRVLYAGRLAAEKNLGSVIQAARALPDIAFAVAGDGPQRDLVASAAARLPNLAYLGWLSRERMRSALDAADMLVLPSHVESFGTVALEAMARARIVMVSHGCGIADWPGLSRGMVTLGEDEPLAAGIRRIAGLDPAVLRRKADTARTAALELNEWNLRHWLDLLRQQRRPARRG
ncbi:MAG: glycosyltransferase [Chromatiales bacterium]|jgi:glycosyltransferase involved in cell wall biosynthesis